MVSLCHLIRLRLAAFIKQFIMIPMKPTKFNSLATQQGIREEYLAGQVFHAQDFPDKLFVLSSGYVKRYQATKPDKKILELIYGPEHIISLSQLYRTLFKVDQNHHNFTYIYQAMTDVVMYSLSADFVIKALENDPQLYKDFFYESGLKLRSNILRLASNSIKDDYKKVAHQIASLAYEFADMSAGDIRLKIELPLPQTPTDIAEQLNISKEVAEAVMISLARNNVIAINGDHITILNMELLKDAYL